jgi:hypothetical protein
MNTTLNIIIGSGKNRLLNFWKTQLNKERSKGKLSKILQAALEEKRRQIIKDRNI